MPPIIAILILIYIFVASALLASHVAEQKSGWEGEGRSPADRNWLLIGLATGPLALLAAVGLPDKAYDDDHEDPD